VLQAAQVQAEPCDDSEQVARLAQAGIGALVLTEEVTATADIDALARIVAGQPPWSELPVIVFASSDPSSLAGRELHERLQPLGNVTILERPVHPATLVSAAYTALRARDRQYEVRDLLAEHERGIKMRDQFLAMLGHELRNPLGALRNMLNVLDLSRDSASLKPVPVEPRHLALLDRQIGHLSRLVDDLLDVSRVTSGKVVLKHERVDLVDLMIRCVHALEGAARGHDLELAAGSGALIVEGDPTRLEQVLTNLLINAIKYTPPKGHIRVAVRRDGADAVVTVADTGAGLTSDMLESVFEPFSQADRTLERAEGGLGVGLTLVRTLVRQHGGEVTAHSPGLGQGSTFEVRLPLAAADAAPSRTPARPSSASRPSTLRILVVEDNADNRDSLVFLLRQLGHEVTEAEDGRRALQAFAAGAYELAFVDIGLPGIDGYEVARRVRAAAGASVHLVALTGYGQPEDRDRSRAAGFDDHLTKPLDLAALDAIVARVSLIRS
jgi:signal transduction histidine kinase/CheY-like chemotaxis protein